MPTKEEERLATEHAQAYGNLYSNGLPKNSSCDPRFFGAPGITKEDLSHYYRVRAAHEKLNHPEVNRESFTENRSSQDETHDPHDHGDECDTSNRKILRSSL